jgi:50S ribosomal subunit-associated GTPase HflX
LIYVIDSSDSERIGLAASELNRILSHPDMQQAVVLIIANKRDVATVSMDHLSDKLGVHSMKRNWAIYPVTAIKDHQSSGLLPAMEWLIDNINQI